MTSLSHRSCIHRVIVAYLGQSHKNQKKADEARRLGAKDVVISGSMDSLKKHRDEFDFILDTIPALHDHWTTSPSAVIFTLLKLFMFPYRLSS